MRNTVRRRKNGRHILFDVSLVYNVRGELFRLHLNLGNLYSSEQVFFPRIVAVGIVGRLCIVSKGEFVVRQGLAVVFHVEIYH